MERRLYLFKESMAQKNPRYIVIIETTYHTATLNYV